MLRDPVSIQYKAPKFKREIGNHFQKSKKSGRLNNVKQKIENVQELNRNNINFIFIGEINVGKSSVINCLLNAEECPIGIRRTTLTNTLVSSEDKKFFNSNYVNLIDTIGFDSKSKDKIENESKWIISQLDKVSHLFFITSYDKCFDTEYELNCFENIYSEIMKLKELNHIIELTIIINKGDESNSDSELKGQISNIKSKLEGYFSKLKIDIVCISAKYIFNELQKSITGKEVDGSKFIGYEQLTKVFRSFFKNKYIDSNHFEKLNTNYYINKNIIHKEISYIDIYNSLEHLNNDLFAECIKNKNFYKNIVFL